MVHPSSHWVPTRCGQVGLDTVLMVIVIFPHPLLHITADTLPVFLGVHLDVNRRVLPGSRG
jgi:hypothetical protein